MATKNPGVDFRLRLLGAAQFAREARDSGIAVKDLGTDAAQAGRKAKDSEGGWGIFQRSARKSSEQAKKTHLSLHKLAGGLAGLGVGFEAANFGKESIGTTKELAEATLNLSNAQGLSTSAAAQWAAVAQVKGIGQSKLAQNFGQLAKNIQLARTQHQSYTRTLSNSGNVDAQQLALTQARDRQLANLDNSAAGRLKAIQVRQAYQQKLDALRVASAKRQGNVVASGAGLQAQAFRRLGITQRDLRKAGTDMSPIMLKIAKGFTDMHGGAIKTSLGLQLFGRGWKNLLPLFKEGNESLETNLKWAREFGVAMGGETTDQMKKFLVAQDKAKYATLGLQVALGSKLAPVLIKIINAWPRLVKNIRDGNGAWGAVRTVIVGIIHPLSAVVGWFQKSKTASKALGIALGVLAAAMVVEEFGAFVRWVRGLTLLTKGWAAAQWLLNAAMEANPFVLAATAIAAVGVALVEAYKHVKWFREGVQATWGWIKDHWPLLVSIMTGPFAPITYLITTHLGSIVSFVKGMPAKLAAGGRGMWDWMKNAFVDVINFVIGKFNWLIRAFNNTAGRIPGVPNVHQIGKLAHAGAGKGLIGSVAAHAKRGVKFAASGGTFTSGDRWVSGEAGPEFNHFVNGKVQVSPAGGGSGKDHVRKVHVQQPVFFQIGKKTIGRAAIGYDLDVAAFGG